MKIDRFDDEFRRKLLGLPADTDPGEVDRIHTHVRTHLPSLLNLGWGKLLLLGGAGLLLVTSLTYNFIQSYRNTHLHSTLDSLSRHRALTKTVIKRDTVYIDRYLKANSNSQEPDPIVANLSTKNESYERSLAGPSKATSSVKANTATELVAPVGDLSIHTQKARNARWVADRKKRSTNSTTTGTNDGSQQRSNSLTSREKATPSAQTNVLARRSSTQRSESAPQLLDHKVVLDAASDKRRKQTDRDQHTSSKAITSADEITPVTLLLENEAQAKAFQSITGRPLNWSSTLSELISAGRLQNLPVKQAVSQKMHRSWHSTLPTLSAPNAAYRVGALATGADDQIGAGFLGEVALNRHWSLQAGIRVLYGQGFHYRNERDFSDHQQEDFRKKYATEVSSTSDIEDINQVSVIAQVPIQLAYHYPLSQQWGLRLGIGTDLDVWINSAVSYEYGDNNRSSERGQTRLKTQAQVLNNLTITPAVEWYRKKWLFRAGPFVNPQLRSVSYKPENLSWGANVQVLYRLGH